MTEPAQLQLRLLSGLRFCSVDQEFASARTQLPLLVPLFQHSMLLTDDNAFLSPVRNSVIYFSRSNWHSFCDDFLWCICCNGSLTGVSVSQLEVHPSKFTIQWFKTDLAPQSFLGHVWFPETKPCTLDSQGFPICIMCLCWIYVCLSV